MSLVTDLHDELGKADPTLIGNEALLATVLSGSGDCIKVLDLDGHLIFMSEGGKRVMEVDDFSALRGCPWPDFWAGNGNIAARNAVETARGGQSARFTGAANTAKGNARFWDVQVLPILGQDGNPSHLLSISRDITEEHKAKAALEQSQAAEKEAAKLEAGALRKLLEDAPSFMCVLKGPDHVYTIANKSYQKLVGFRNLIGLPVRDGLPELAGQGYFELLDEVYTTGLPFVGKGVSMDLRHTPGGPLNSVFLNFVYQPIFADDGTVSGIFVEGSDVTEQITAELDLKAKELQLKLALDAAEMGVWECTVEDGRFVNLKEDERAMRLLSRDPQEAVDFDGFSSRVHPDDRAALGTSARKALDPDGDGILDVEYRMLERPGFPAHWIRARAQAVSENGKVRFIGTVRDITSRKDAIARQEMLSGELHHRIKNLMAMISAIASQTLRGEDISERRDRFTARLAALGQAQSMLVSGMSESASVTDTINQALAPHVDSEGRASIDGPEFRMTPRQTLSMALTIHELATNAVKYGALSVDSGHVDVSWSLTPIDASEEILNFVWKETGGPTVTVPSTRGFGSRLISRVLAADFNGDVTVTYDPNGVICELRANIHKMI
jgi:two-component sensor histidine kinase